MKPMHWAAAGTIPIIFIFDGNVADEILAFQFIQDGRNILGN